MGLIPLFGNVSVCSRSIEVCTGVLNDREFRKTAAEETLEWIKKRCVQLSKVIWGPQFPSTSTVAFRLPRLGLLLIENRETDDAGMHRNRNGGRGSKCNNTIQQM